MGCVQPSFLLCTSLVIGPHILFSAFIHIPAFPTLYFPPSFFLLLFILAGFVISTPTLQSAVFQRAVVPGQRNTRSWFNRESRDWGAWRRKSEIELVQHSHLVVEINLATVRIKSEQTFQLLHSSVLPSIQNKMMTFTEIKQPFRITSSHYIIRGKAVLTFPWLCM